MPNDDPGVINLDDARAAKQRRDELGAIAAAHVSGRSRAHAVSSRNHARAPAPAGMTKSAKVVLGRGLIKASSHSLISLNVRNRGQPLDPLRLGGGDRLVVK